MKLDVTFETLQREYEERMNKTFKVPDELAHKYKGCGSGRAVIEIGTNKVLDFDYTSPSGRKLKDQNVEMCNDGGRIIKQTKTAITYRANFSCYQICLY